jgi:acetyl-CoA C-acetyltransferase
MPDAYVIDGIRTAFGRYGGGLATVRADELAAIPIRALCDRLSGLNPADIDDVIYGCVNQAGEDSRNVARMAILLAGLPPTVPGVTLNRLCGSGMDAVAMAARTVRSEEADFIIAGGVEQMTRAPFVMAKAESAFSRQVEVYDTTIGARFYNPRLAQTYGTDSMPQTGDNVSEEFGISRADQDAFALRSQERWARAQKAGVFADEITPVTIPQHKGDPWVIDVDEHPRPEIEAAQLARLKPLNGHGKTVTAGNASGVNDGAAALLVASEAAAHARGLQPRARIVGAAVAGLEPRIMGYGPVPAVKKLLARTGLTIDKMDVIELNEAFAAQGLAVMRGLGLPDDAPQVNANGGAIAIGHPLGASGARLVLTATNQLHRGGGRYALCTMCIGVGQGIALILERV